VAIDDERDERLLGEQRRETTVVLASESVRVGTVTSADSGPGATDTGSETITGRDWAISDG